MPQFYLFNVRNKVSTYRWLIYYFKIKFNSNSKEKSGKIIYDGVRSRADGFQYQCSHARHLNLERFFYAFFYCFFFCLPDWSFLFRMARQANIGDGKTDTCFAASFRIFSVAGAFSRSFATSFFTHLCRLPFFLLLIFCIWSETIGVVKNWMIFGLQWSGGSNDLWG